ETVLLTLSGGALGILVGWWALGSTPALHLELLPRGSEIRLDWATAAAIFALSLTVGLAAGLVPVAQLSRGQLTEALREGGRSGTAGAAAGRVRRGLATAQVVLPSCCSSAPDFCSRASVRFFTSTPAFSRRESSRRR